MYLSVLAPFRPFQGALFGLQIPSGFWDPGRLVAPTFNVGFPEVFQTAKGPPRTTTIEKLKSSGGGGVGGRRQPPPPKLLEEVMIQKLGCNDSRKEARYDSRKETRRAMIQEV